MSRVEDGSSREKDIDFRVGLENRFPFQSYGFAASSSFSLLRGRPEVDVYRPIYQSIAKTKEEIPLNREEWLLPDLIRMAEERNLVLGTLSPYWSSESLYDPREVFGTAIQFLDYHEASLPSTTLPPERDVARYINTVLGSEEKLTVSQQLELLLDITDNNLLGAANLGYIASRVMARGLDTRAYPNIRVGKDEMIEWNSKVAQFETYNGSNESDGPGDTYYFWTHMFCALYYQMYNGFGKNVYNFSFENGTDIMKFARRQIANTPINSDHREATLLGRHLGLALFGSLSEAQSIAPSKTFVEQQDDASSSGLKFKRKGLVELGTTIIDYLANDKEFTVYEHPEQYEAGALSAEYRRDNLARGVADVVVANSDFDEDRRVLDIGAGTGILSLELAKRGNTHVTSFDLFSQQLRLLRDKALAAKLEENISAVQGDMNTQFPFENRSFNVVVSLRATRYITDFKQWLSEVNRVLEPGGVFVLPVFSIDMIPWKRHSNKGVMQETTAWAMVKKVSQSGFQIDYDASKKYDDAVDSSLGERDLPFYYKPSRFIVARKPLGK